MVSVIVPVYNAGCFLKELIESVLSQTYTDIELLLIDDGSTDGSGLLCDEYAKTDPRVRSIHKQNGGQSSARNLGLECARGELIAFADHDDVLHPRMYETLINAMDQTGADISACMFENTENDVINRIDFTKPILPAETVKWEWLVERFFTPDWHIPVWNKLYRKELLEGICFHDARLGEDNLFSYRVLKRCGEVAFCPSVMYFQRMHGGNFEFTGVKYMVDLLGAKQTILADIKKSFPGEYRACQKRYIYECVRIYNLYAAFEDQQYASQRAAVVDMLKLAIKDGLYADIPLAHKLKIAWFVSSKKARTGQQIVL